MPETTVQNELSKHIVILHTDTLSYLLKRGEVGRNAATLYSFYGWVSSWQYTTQVRATDAFCIQGLHWGPTTFRNAKKLLIDSGIIETAFSRQGKLNTFYVTIKFIKRSPAREIDLASSRRTSPASTSALDIQSININIKNSLLRKETGLAKTPTCPLLVDPPLKEKYPRGHIECVEYISSFKFVNKPKQFKFLHQMLRTGLDFSDIDKLRFKAEKKKFFRENGYDMASLAGEADRGSNAAR